ncbi:MAG: hypothetical protein ACKVQW_04850 [Pyrinomonadaceae bacterium]
MGLIKGAGIVSSILVIIALVITLLKAVIGFVGFLALAIKILIVIVFIGVFASVAFMIFRAWQDKQRKA